MAAGHATNPPPRASWWHERRGLLASGLHSPSRFPSGVLSGGPGRSGPGTRYSGGAAPDFHRLPSNPRSCVISFSAAASLSVRPSARKRALEQPFQASPLFGVETPFLGRRLSFTSEIPRVKRSDGFEEVFW
jgi:hypothetical protein